MCVCVIVCVLGFKAGIPGIRFSRFCPGGNLSRDWASIPGIPVCVFFAGNCTIGSAPLGVFYKPGNPSHSSHAEEHSGRMDYAEIYLPGHWSIKF